MPFLPLVAESFLFDAAISKLLLAIPSSDAICFSSCVLADGIVDDAPRNLIVECTRELVRDLELTREVRSVCRWKGLLLLL